MLSLSSKFDGSIQMLYDNYITMFLLEESDTAATAWDEELAKQHIRELEHMISVLNIVPDDNAPLSHDQFFSLTSTLLEYSRRITIELHYITRQTLHNIADLLLQTSVILQSRDNGSGSIIRIAGVIGLRGAMLKTHSSSESTEYIDSIVPSFPLPEGEGQGEG